MHFENTRKYLPSILEHNTMSLNLLDGSLTRGVTAVDVGLTVGKQLQIKLYLM